MKIVIALGGNALGNDYIEQQLKVKETMREFVPLIKEGHEIIITHGNGPQVGVIDLAFQSSTEEVPLMPLDAATAMSQGYIGYHVQKELREVLMENKINKKVVTLVTQVLVDENDISFKNPTKPIGLFYDEPTAQELTIKTGDKFIEDSGRGYRKVVASPRPQGIIELESIKDLITNNHIVIACGGGGIPVISDINSEKVSAVIDKDLASSKLAILLDADCLIILTTLNQACLNYGQENSENIGKINSDTAKQYIAEGHFAKGSMLPKIEACLEFVEITNKKAIITGIDNLKNAISEINCTVITK